MRKLIIILLLLISFAASSQVLQKDVIFGREFQRVLPDSLIAIPTDTFRVSTAIRTYPWFARKGSTFYAWNTSTFIWEALSTGGSSKAKSGTTLSGDTVLLGGTPLDRYTAIELNGYPLTFRHDGVNATAQNDSNAIRLFNNTTATAAGDSLSSPAIVQSTKGFKTIGSASQPVSFRQDVVGASAVSAASAIWRIKSSINGAAYNTIFAITSAGLIPNPLNLNGSPIGQRTTGGTGNLFFGLNALSASTITPNIAIGQGALQVSTTGRYNVAIGVNALQNADTSFNTAIGHNALAANTTGEQNTAVGYNTLLVNSTGIKNTAIGAGAMEGTTTGGFNTAIGHDALLRNTIGTDNVGLGWLAWSQNIGGDFNIGIGNSTGRSVSDGDYNIMIGYNTGFNASQATTVSNSILLGHDLFSTASNQMILGSTTISSVTINGVSSTIDTTTYKPFVIDANGVVKRGNSWAQFSAGGSGNVTKVGTPADNQVGVWTGDGTIEGASTLTYDGNQFKNKAASGVSNIRIEYSGGTTIYQDLSIDGSGNSIFNSQGADLIFRRSGTNVLNMSINTFTLLSGINLNVDGNSLYVNAATNRVGVLSASPTSSLHTFGSFATAYVAKTGTYTATESDHTIECTSGTFTVTLPTAVGISGRQYCIVNSGAGTITIGTTSSQTFANVVATPTTLTLAAVGWYTVVSNGANWLVVSN